MTHIVCDVHQGPRSVSRGISGKYAHAQIKFFPFPIFNDHQFHEDRKEGHTSRSFLNIREQITLHNGFISTWTLMLTMSAYLIQEIFLNQLCRTTCTEHSNEVFARANGWMHQKMVARGNYNTFLNCLFSSVHVAVYSSNSYYEYVILIRTTMQKFKSTHCRSLKKWS
jgi:hypothetical protein